MDDYSFWADVLTTFRSSSDLVKTIWLLTPVLLATSIIFTILKFRRPIVQSPPRPVFTFDTSEFGRVEVYRAEPGALSETLIKLNEFSPLLNHAKDLKNKTQTNRA